MLTISTAHPTSQPGQAPLLSIPRLYNAAFDLIQRNLQAGRAGKIAYIDDQTSITFGELHQRCNRFAHVLQRMGIAHEQRILLCLHDTIDFPTAFLGAISAGVVPVAANTLLTADDYEYMLTDSRAQLVVVSQPLLALWQPLFSRYPQVKWLVSDPSENTADLVNLEIQSQPHSLRQQISQLPAEANEFVAVETVADEACFWLYSSGSTGAPKGTVHIHSSLIQTAELYARPVLGIHEKDVVFSAAKLFFAYGLGNGLSFPLSVGATTLLMAERPTPAAIYARLLKHQPTIFYGVPTLYAAMLAHSDIPDAAALNLRVCASAGEPLPADIGKRFRAHFGVDILDGIGSTEMLHIYLSNRADKVRYGTTGFAVPGYALRIVDDDGVPVKVGDTGELQVAGPTAAMQYFNQRAKSRRTFVGEWTRSGDKYRQDEDGYYIYAGRSDDMLKVSGIYVSPIEVESALITHPDVLEAAVVGAADADGLVKPKAFVVVKAGVVANEALADTLKQHVKTQLAPYKYPRWISFVSELPKTATGKIQRFKLRG